MQPHKTTYEISVSSSDSTNSATGSFESSQSNDTAFAGVGSQDAKEYIMDMVLELRDMARAVDQAGIADALAQIHSQFSRPELNET